MIFVCPEQLRQIVADGDGVIFIQRRNRVVDIDVFHPLIGFVTIQRKLRNGEKEAPDEDILFAARHLDVVDVSLRAHVSDLAGKADLPSVVVDVEIEVGVACKKGRMRLSISSSVKPGEKAGLGIIFKHTLAVAFQIIIPMKQVFGEGVEVERVAVRSPFLPRSLNAMERRVLPVPL